MPAHELDGGFADAAVDAAHAFRAVMTVMARPGEIRVLSGARPPEPLSPAAGVVLLTLCDPETPLYLAPGHDTPAVRAWIRFHSGAPLVAPEQAMFAVGRWSALPQSRFAIGTPEYPDRSATLIVEIDELAATGYMLRGPGIRDSACLSLPESAVFEANARLFPLGMDFIFTCRDRVASLPRTTRVA